MKLDGRVNKQLYLLQSILLFELLKKKIMIKNYLKTVTSLLMSGIFLFLAFGSENNDNSKTKQQVTCPTGENTSYSSGYASGQLSRNLGGSSSCESYVNSYNEQLGRNVMSAGDCFCQGFDDGYSGKPKK